MDLEPGLQPAEGRLRSIKMAWNKAAALIITVVVVATLLVVSHGPRPTLELPEVRDLEQTNDTAQHYFASEPWLNPLDQRDEAYDKVVEKGHWLVCLMNMRSDQVTPQSPWMNFEALNDHGWEFTKESWKGQEQFDRVSSDKPAPYPLGHLGSDFVSNCERIPTTNFLFA